MLNVKSVYNEEVMIQKFLAKQNRSIFYFQKGNLDCLKKINQNSKISQNITQLFQLQKDQNYLCKKKDCQNQYVITRTQKMNQKLIHYVKSWVCKYKVYQNTIQYVKSYSWGVIKSPVLCEIL
eukprot:TRINITY_DN14238_c0_g1_i2.p3 TRINITY_DN14238_c0_g1~~TRINITY_DN14238_c0_g1_i2.p3  ORF type:complete len:123 (+),score=1.34 TRINITY_DN14238_c0_g1_i2:55-423(+)